MDCSHLLIYYITYKFNNKLMLQTLLMYIYQSIRNQHFKLNNNESMFPSLIRESKNNKSTFHTVIYLPYNKYQLYILDISSLFNNNNILLIYIYSQICILSKPN